MPVGDVKYDFSLDDVEPIDLAKFNTLLAMLDVEFKFNVSCALTEAPNAHAPPFKKRVFMLHIQRTS